jgi:hypothetical protein
MTTFYLVGGEDSEFSSSGTTSVTTTSTFYRSTYARCALVSSQTGTTPTTNGWWGSWSAMSTFYVAARVYLAPFTVGGFTSVQNVILFRDGIVNRLMVRSSASNQWVLSKQDASGTVTVLQTSSDTISTLASQRIDIYVNYGTSGTFQMYVGGSLVLNYSGDLTTNSATALSGVGFNCPNNQSGTGNAYWSEIIVADSDTRGWSLATLPVNASGNTQAWSGANTDINESTLNDSTAISTTSASQVSEWTVSPASTIGSTTGIISVHVSARAAKGGSGPANLQAMVRTGSTDYTSSNLSSISTVLGCLQSAWLTNPNTGVAWTGSDLTAAGFNIGVKSIT